ncbi:MAG TPA: hypothetical protein PK885_09835, partial [Candidatus Marinimicrobia bacterium]|nr:hypothetical protein [Candidatus Neomarinimicrobiota bacterium]
MNHASSLYRKANKQWAISSRLVGILFIVTGLLNAQHWQVDTLKIAAGDSVVYLSHRFVIPETIELNIADSISLDPLTGAITFHSARTDSMFFIAKYQYLPLNLPLNRIVNLPPRIYTGHETAELSSADYPARPPAQYSTETTDFLKSGTL